MKNITIIASMFLVISLAHAEWERIPGSEEMGYVYAMASDGEVVLRAIFTVQNFG